jgi:hypothetical protein
MNETKFITYQHDDDTWFHVAIMQPSTYTISLRNIKTGLVQTIQLKDSQAFALKNILNLIIERGDTCQKKLPT